MQPDSPAPQPAPASQPSINGLSKSADNDMLEEGESILTVVHRSLMGLVGIYLVAVVALAAVIGLVIAVSPSAFESNGGSFSSSLSAVVLVAIIFLALILFTVTYIYRQSRLLVTNKSLVQIMQKTL